MFKVQNECNHPYTLRPSMRHCVVFVSNAERLLQSITVSYHTHAASNRC